MLLFGNTFCPKNTPADVEDLDWSTREIELGLEYGAPVMNIGGHSLTFEDGQWILSETTAEYHLMEKELEKMKIHSRRKK
uniref:Uncharacterized protein n=1 Tax=Oncorhynchus kisutch TaxID=8019 RepID=A0A8C7CUG4_ONCKI